MASIDTVRTGKEGRMLFYDLDHAVGPGAPNRRDDVLLVQYFMKQVPNSRRFQSAPFPAPLNVNGIADQSLFANIRHFQAACRKINPLLSVVDGKIDPVPGDKNRSPTSKAQYSIINLNLLFRDARPIDYERVSEAADCPADLRKQLAPRFMAMAA
jgi:hypothetical protein